MIRLDLTHLDPYIKRVKWVKQVKDFKPEPDPYIKWVKRVDPFMTQTCLSSTQTYLRWVKRESGWRVGSCFATPNWDGEGGAGHQHFIIYIGWWVSLSLQDFKN